jgi:hypothetical protein
MRTRSEGHEASAPTISASGRRGCHVAGSLADRDGANRRADRLMLGYAADTDRYTCTER